MKLQIPIDILLEGVLFLFSFLLLFFIILAQIKRKRMRKERRQERWLAEQEDAFIDFLDTGNWSIKGNVQKQWVREAIESFFLNSLATVNEPIYLKRITHFVEENFAATYQKKLASRSFTKRMNTLYRIEKFHCTSFQEYLYERCVQADMVEEEKILMLQILATFQDHRIFDVINEKDFYLSSFHYFDLFERIEDSMIQYWIHTFFEEMKLDFQYAVVEYIGNKGWSEYESFLLRLAQTEETELRIRVYKSLFSFHYIQDITPLFPYFETDIWQEKMWLSKISMIHHHDYCVPYLRKWIADASWYVRRAAASALYSYPNGKRELENIVQYSEDAFARDVAMECLEKRGG